MNLLPRTIARKLVFYLGLTNCLVLGATVWFSYGRARTMLVEQIDATALQQVRTAAIRLDDFLAKAAIRAEMIASRQNARLASASPTATNSMEMPSEFDPGLMPLLVRMLKDAPLDEAYGVWICRVPTEGQTVHDGDLLATHRHTWPKRTVFEPDYLATIPDQEWFSGTQKTGKPCITEPYYDEGGGNASMVSLSHPCFDERNRLVAVSGVDVELARIYHIISELQEAVTREKGVGYAFLVSAAGRIITHPEVKFMLGKNNPGARITDLAEGSLVANRPNGSCVAHLAGEDRRLYWSTAPVANWKIVFNMSNLVITRRVGNLATTIGLLGLGGVLLSSVVLVIIAGGISRPLVRLTAIAQKVAAGDLHGAKLGLSSFDKSNQAGVRSPADETGQLLAAIQTMTNSLSNLIGQVQRAGVQITSTAQQIAATAREQEKTVNTFGSSTSEISASVREISATNQELLNTMNSVSAVATQTASLAESGSQLLHTRQEAMNQMRTATGSISGKLSVMNQRAGDINMVITTITKVADQTNLLSLNAAIEAEKAGEAGLGFSVVAREIRRLADQTAAATLDIERMVKEMQSSVSSGVMEMDKFSQGVSRDVEEMATLTTRLEQIIQQVQGLTSRFEEVNVGMRAQSEGAEQISAAMTHLNDGARQTAASLNEFNQATRNLDTAVAGLRDHISRFKVNG